MFIVENVHWHKAPFIHSFIRSFTSHDSAIKYINPCHKMSGVHRLNVGATSGMLAQLRRVGLITYT